MRSKVLVLVAVMLSSAYCYVTGYHVEPIKAAWSGWTAFQGYVSQGVTCNFDGLSYVELFAGEKGKRGTLPYLLTGRSRWLCFGHV